MQVCLNQVITISATHVWLKDVPLQHWPKGLQHLHVRKMRAIWWIYTQITCKKYASKILHDLLHAPQLHVNCEYFGKG